MGKTGQHLVRPQNKFKFLHILGRVPQFWAVIMKINSRVQATNTSPEMQICAISPRLWSQVCAAIISEILFLMPTQTCTFLSFILYWAGTQLEFFPFHLFTYLLHYNIPVNMMHLILNSIHTHQVSILVENVLSQQFIMRSGKKQEVAFKKWVFLVQSVKIHPAHCAHEKKPNESQSVPEIKPSNYCGKKPQSYRKWVRDED